MAGTNLLDRYKVGRIIGQGGMGEIYLAEDEKGREYALKIMNETYSGRPKLRERFEIEIDALDRCRGPFVLELVDRGEISKRAPVGAVPPDSVPAYVSELCSGNLFELCKTRLPTVGRSIQILCEILVALDHVHTMGFVHRDVKPSNILLTKDSAVRLADFGIARHPERRVTEQGQRLGTPSYVAPDMTVDPAGAMPNHDLFSVGLLAYMMFTGQNPKESSPSNPRDLLVKKDFALKDRRFSHVEDDIAELIRKATHHDRARRYETAPQMAADFQRILSGMETEEPTGDEPGEERVGPNEEGILSW